MMIWEDFDGGLMSRAISVNISASVQFIGKHMRES
jgi:hypothetical protein